MTYRPGDFWRIDDNTGFRVRSSRTSRQWDGLITADPDERNPQDFVRGRRDQESVPDPRPEPAIVTIGPLTTTTSAAASAGDTTLSLTSSSGMSAGHVLGIMLDTGSIHRATVNTVPNSTSVTLTAALPYSVSSGAVVTDYSSVSEPTF
jgi:hypothetical protein